MQYSPAAATCHLVQPVIAPACVWAGGAAVTQVESVSGDCAVVEAAASEFAIMDAVDEVSDIDEEKEELDLSVTDSDDKLSAMEEATSVVCTTSFAVPAAESVTVATVSVLVMSISSVLVCVTFVVLSALLVPVPIVYVSVVTVVCVRIVLASGGPTVQVVLPEEVIVALTDARVALATGALVIVAFEGAVPFAAKVPLLASVVVAVTLATTALEVALEARHTLYPSRRSWQSSESAAVLAS